jgi:hypothetical protein
MQIKLNLYKLLAVLAVLTASFLVSPLPISAQGVPTCVPGTEGTNCIPCIPGPYNICVPQTDITIGNTTIDESVLVLILGAYGVGIALLINGSMLQQRLKVEEVEA